MKERMRSVATLLVFCAICLPVQAARPAAVVATKGKLAFANSLELPAGGKSAVFFGSNSSGVEQGILFLDNAGNVVRDMPLTPVSPPAVCLDTKPFPRTVHLVAYAVLTRTALPVRITRNEDFRFWTIDILDANGVVITETATLQLWAPSSAPECPL